MTSNGVGMSYQMALNEVRYDELLAQLEMQVGRLNRGVERDRCKRAGLAYHPRRVFAPDMEALKRLSREIRRLPARRRLSAGQARVYVKTLVQLRRRQARVEYLVQRALHREAELAFRVRKTALLMTARNVNELRARLLVEKGRDGLNVNAVALGKLSRRRHPLTREEYSERGRQGAQVRWQRARGRTRSSAG